MNKVVFPIITTTKKSNKIAKTPHAVYQLNDYLPAFIVSIAFQAFRHSDFCALCGYNSRQFASVASVAFQ